MCHEKKDHYGSNYSFKYLGISSTTIIKSKSPSKSTFSSGKVLTIIVWIIIPLGYMLFSIITNQGGLGTLLSGELYYIPFPLNYLSPVYIPPIPLTLMLLGFAIIPAIYSTPKFFRKRGFVNVIIEYQYLKKILYISVFILIGLIGLYYYLIIVYLPNAVKQTEQDESIRRLEAKQNSYLEKFTPQLNKILSVGGSAEEVGKHYIEILNQDKQYYKLVIELGNILTSKAPLFVLVLPLWNLLFMVMLVPLSIIIKLLLPHSRKEFQLYYAKGCFKIISKADTDEIDKAR